MFDSTKPQPASMNCPLCNKEVSNTAVSCVHCGHKLRDSDGMFIFKALAWMVVVGMIVAFLI
ncbi:MAG: hypothetical protein RDU14_03045 [Melioribacteraceae bacterium]|nr:hypothetical protein [Melioribacteraceae bacterium]